MMNVLALSLILTTLITAGVFSPTSENNNININGDGGDDNVIVKDGHRRVVVEYDTEDKSNTRVFISPDQVDHGDGGSSKLSTPRELVCDAYGKCKHKIASAIGRTYEKIYEKAQDAEEEVKEGFEKVKDTVSAPTPAPAAKEKIKEMGSEISEKAKEAKETVKEKTNMDQIGGRIKHGVGELLDMGKTLKGDIERNASKSMEKVQKNKDKMLPAGKVAGILQLLGTSTGLGTSLWVTFGSSYLLARALPRQQFAIVQSKIYPVYFKSMAFNIGAVLIGHIFTNNKIRSSGSSSGTQETIQTVILLVSLAIEFINMLVLEPRATKIVFDRMKLEKEGGGDGGRGKESSRTTVEPTGRIIDGMTESAINRAAAGRTAEEEEEGAEGIRPKHQYPATTATRTRSTRTSTAATAAREEQETVPEQTEEEAASKNAEMIRLSKRLKKLNNLSSFLNLLAIMALSWHLVHLGHTLHSVY